MSVRGSRWQTAVFATAVVLFTTGLGVAQLAPAAPPIPDVRMPFEGVWTGGQPTPEQLEQVALARWRTVINLRADGEPGFEWERETAERLGLRYVHLPIHGAADLTRTNVERLDSELRDALVAGPVLLHCASGNRVGALLALREAWLRGAEAEAALKLGLAAGLAGLEPATRELLGLPPRPAPGVP